MDDEQDKEPRWCPGCDRTLPDDGKLWFMVDGISNDVCRECWDSMRPFERVLLRLLANSDAQGLTLGAMSTLDDLNETARKAFRAYHGHSPSGMCSSCDPERMRQYREEIAARRSKSEPTPPADPGTLPSSPARDAP